MSTVEYGLKNDMLDVCFVGETMFIRMSASVQDGQYLELLNALLKIRDEHRSHRMALDLSEFRNVPFTLFCMLQGFGQQSRKQGWEVSVISASGGQVTPASLPRQ